MRKIKSLTLVIGVWKSFERLSISSRSSDMARENGGSCNACMSCVKYLGHAWGSNLIVRNCKVKARLSN